jgi:hypothetical protein
MSCESQFEKTRRRLTECVDFVALRDCGHDLKDGVVLTSVNDVPSEMSFKCVVCDKVFWFENLSWQSRKIVAWRLNDESRAALAERCTAHYYVAVQGEQSGEVIRVRNTV